ncbi:UPF0392 protein F13G3.3 [Elysia marginata]|uniref:UPF0392 protein F13G3.3 n=1 Tax=Elysia marginata TaxID=1093978 RepID=A0AAV4FAH9_9GAST|nr:UPF0392 protein F13G3.3 [Elysia marginata]
MTSLLKFRALGVLITVILLQVVMVTHWVIPISRRERGQGEGEPEAGGGRSPCCTMSQATADWGPNKGALLVGPRALLYQEAATEGPDHFSRVGTLDVWMFSAFYDRDTGGYGGPIVRLFGLAARAYKNRPVLCRFGLPGKGEVTTKGRLLMLPDDHMVKIPPFEVECPLKNGPLPSTVSMSVENEKGTMEPIHVEYRSRRKRKREFTVCFASFHSNYNFTSQLVQSVEMNLLLGAEHFYLYNTSISRSTDAVIRHYQALGIFTVVQWPVPNESWYKAQMALINDCTYRNRNQSEYVVFTDTDEFIIPRSHMTWHDMVADLFRDPGLSHVFAHSTNAGVPEGNSLLPRRRLLSVPDKGTGDHRDGKARSDQKIVSNSGNIGGSNGQAKPEEVQKQLANKPVDNLKGGSNGNPAYGVAGKSGESLKGGLVDDAGKTKEKVVYNKQQQQPQHQQQQQPQQQQQQQPQQQQQQQQQPIGQGGPQQQQQQQQQQQPPKDNQQVVQPQQAGGQQGENQPAPPAKQPAAPQWSKLLEDLSVPKIPVLDDKSEQELKQRRLPVAGFHFRCVFFDNRMMGPWQSMKATRDQFGLAKEEESFIDRYNIQLLSVFTRTDYSFADKVRTKIIARPEFVHTMGIHFIRREVRGSRLGWVKPEVGLLHHYRFFDWKHSNHVDHAAFKFKDELIARLKVRFAALRSIFP